jgi:hypothetical protein
MKDWEKSTAMWMKKPTMTMRRIRERGGPESVEDEAGSIGGAAVAAASLAAVVTSALLSRGSRSYGGGAVLLLMVCVFV